MKGHGAKEGVGLGREVVEGASGRVGGEEGRFDGDIGAAAGEDLTLGMRRRSCGGYWLGRRRNILSRAAAQGEHLEETMGEEREEDTRPWPGLPLCHHSAGFQKLLTGSGAFSDQSPLKIHRGTGRGGFPSIPDPTTAHPFFLDQIYTRWYF